MDEAVQPAGRLADLWRRAIDATGAGGRWVVAHGALVGAAGALTLVALTGLVAGERGRRARGGADDSAALARGRAAVDSLTRLALADETTPPGRHRLDAAALVALGYVARAEIGVGSPFRIAAFALRDPRLPASLGRTIAWAVLDRAARGETYALATPLPGAPGGPPPARQSWVIDSAIAAAPDARTGETAVRIGYALAAAEGTVGARTVGGVTRLAAQARDRRLAREDAAALLRGSARDRDADALALMLRWRAERRFGVEQPLLGDALHADEAAAVRAGIRLRDVLRGSAVATVPTGATIAPVSGVTTRAAATVLPPGAARRLAELATVRGGPPQAPVVVATAAYRRQLANGPADDQTVEATGVLSIAARRRFAERARSEESLVAELAALAPADGPASAEVAGVALVAAVGMRAFAQDTVLPVAGVGPSAEAVRARFGLRAVTFDQSVPSAWRPYYAAELAGALDDLRLVLPWVEFDGLAVRIGESVKRDSALALHDPASRTVFLPAATGAGTIAHELAHDLDWQTARTRLALRGVYSSDRAMRDGRGALGVSVRGLAAARPRTTRLGWRQPASERPTEMFARGVDWYVAASLAAAGRTNGALSAVQDETLSGYAGVVAPDAGDLSADALVGVLADMTVVPASARSRFLGRYGAGGLPSAAAIVWLAAGTSTRGGTERALRSYELLRPACVSAAPAVTAATWRSALLQAAAESRARGMLLARGRRWTAAPARWSWEARAAIGGPWNPALADSAVARGRDAIVRAVAWDDAQRHPLAAGPMAAVAAGALSGCR